MGIALLEIDVSGTKIGGAISKYFFGIYRRRVFSGEDISYIAMDIH